MAISQRWLKMAEIYKIFSGSEFDLSEKAMEEMYNHETYGVGKINSDNGYAAGKRFMDVQIAAWKEDIEKGLLCKFELYEDEKYPSWFWDMIGIRDNEAWSLNYSDEFIQAKMNHANEVSACPTNQ